MSAQILIFLTVHSTRRASRQSIRILSICAAIMIIAWSTTRTLNTTKASKMKVVERILRMKMLSKTWITTKTILLVKWPVSVIIDSALSNVVLLLSGRVCQSRTACYICKIFRLQDHKKKKGTWARSKSGQYSLKIRSIKSKTFQVKKVQKNNHLRELLLRSDKMTMKTEWNFLYV